ncbi:MAG TPA: cytochrome c oxidase accessory protein CcoG [Usitatibacter sp.]|nr:cytochrome c oxidase accessory protein CcoG [Usitatibacter sp.]
MRPGETIEEKLYEVRKKIYPRAVRGWFAAWRWALVWATQLVFYGGAWLTWNGRQALLFDIAHRKFYIFGLVFWPQDIIYLSLLLIVSALALFLFTAVGGRLWCGYACPQTVYTEIFLWIEKIIEGERTQRIRLDREKLGPRKFGLKTAKHAVWIAISLWTGFTFVGYFSPIRELWHEALTLFAWIAGGPAPSIGPWETFWVRFYGFATYGNAGWMREQVCMYMCPYARFQSAMFDRDTLIITYDPVRGEPRGSRSKSADPRALGLGDCVDCNICVQVCPTGIDIREGLQYECIGCAACIDGCNQVMRKMGYPEGLIRYSTENALEKGWTGNQIVRRTLRPRVLIYFAILAAIIAAAGTSLWMRVPIKMDVIRDRAALAREVDEERIENVFQLRVMNTDERPHRFTLEVPATEHLREVRLIADPQPIEIEGTSSKLIAARVQAKPHEAERSQAIEFVLRTVDGTGRPVVLHEKSRFLVPSSMVRKDRHDEH